MSFFLYFLSLRTLYPSASRSFVVVFCLRCKEPFQQSPPKAYTGFPFSISSQLVHRLVILYRLSTLDDPTGDKSGVQGNANLLLFLDQVMNEMEQVATAARLDNSASIEGDVISRTAKLL